MKTNDELNALVAEKLGLEDVEVSRKGIATYIFYQWPDATDGVKGEYRKPVPDYCGDISEAWPLFVAMSDNHIVNDLSIFKETCRDFKPFTVMYDDPDDTEWSTVIADTGQKAIVLAFLKSEGVEVD